MATKLVKPVSRELEVTDDFDNSDDVIVTMKVSGIEMRRKGTSRTLFIPWSKIGHVADLPGAAPARHVANPLGWLVQK
jgi:hypothetical protein